MASFTKEQQEAITTAMTSNVYITATAGSGKSTTLAQIAKDILAENSTNKVLLITFTNKSAKDIIGKAGMSSRIDGGTFHSVAYRLMRDNGYNFNICDTNKQNMIIRKIFDCKKDKKEFEKIKNEISITKCDYPQRSCTYTERYNTELAKYNMYDFDDIIFNGIEFIKEKTPEFSYTHILVDELQDTSMSQLEFLKQIYDKYDCRMIGVGDLSQSIYEWRGARPENVDDFITYFKCKVKPLGLNFRSKNNIVNAARRVIENNKTHKKIDIRAFDKTNGKIAVYPQTSPLNEIDTVISLCRLNRNKNILILYRDRTNKMPLEFELRKARLEYTVNDSTDIIDRSSFRVFISLMKIAAREYDIYDLEIVTKAVKKLGTSTIEAIKKAVDENKSVAKVGEQLNLFDVITDDDTFHEKVSKLANINKKIKNGCIELFKLQSEFIKIQKAGLTLNTLVKVFPDYLIGSFDVPKDISEFLEDITEDYQTTITDIKELCNNFGLDNKTDEVFNENAKIELSTIHGMKGGECDVVIMPFCNWKFKNDERVKDIVESERRLFYVAVTRAKSELYLLYSGYDKPQFIDEMKI